MAGMRWDFDIVRGRQALRDLARRVREDDADAEINLNGYGECASMDDLRRAVEARRNDAD